MSISLWMQHCLAFSLVLFTTVATAAEPKLQLPIGTDTYTLNAFHDLMSETYFGMYGASDEHLRGTWLKLFPNGRFAIVGWSDIGSDELQALGRYTVHADQLALHFASIRPGQENLEKQFARLHLLWGWIEKKEYVTGFEAFIFTQDEWQILHKNPEHMKYLQRKLPYYDWEKTLHGYDSESGMVRKRSD